jgi:hypothetical protein
MAIKKAKREESKLSFFIIPFFPSKFIECISLATVKGLERITFA